MKPNTLRILNSCGVAIAACGIGIYNTLHRSSSNSVDYQLRINYQAHPLASIIGSMIPGIIAGFAFYWWDSRRARQLNSHRMVHLTWALLVVLIALLAFLFFQMTTNKNHEAVKAVANDVNTSTVTQKQQIPAVQTEADLADLTSNKWADPKWVKQQLDAADHVADVQTLNGFDYYNGKGVPQNYVEAVKWWRRAANQGDADAQIMISAAYVNGQGVETNYVEAYKWVNIASAQGNSLATTRRDALAASMTPDQIAEAQKLSTEFQPHTESASTNSN